MFLFYVIQSANNFHCQVSEILFLLSFFRHIKEVFLKEGVQRGARITRMEESCLQNVLLPSHSVRATSSPVHQLLEAKSGTQSLWLTQVNVETWHDKYLNLHILLANKRHIPSKSSNVESSDQQLRWPGHQRHQVCSARSCSVIIFASPASFKYFLVVTMFQ